VRACVRASLKMLQKKMRKNFIYISQFQRINKHTNEKCLY